MALLPFTLFSVAGVGCLFGAFVAFILLRIVYRLTLHPLARFPGPKLAAATSLYNAYYDCIGSGLCKDLPELHRKYGTRNISPKDSRIAKIATGPIVRIQPDELHLGELEDYNQYTYGAQPLKSFEV